MGLRIADEARKVRAKRKEEKEGCQAQLLCQNAGTARRDPQE